MAFTLRSRAKRALLLTTSVLAFGVGGAAAAGALPTGGAVTSGTAGIASTSSQVTVTQSSAKAIVTWSDFSIGQGNTVQFNNGSGSTLNRVTGSNASAIDGALNATGSVYLINQNGIVIGNTGVVNVGGSFVASTLDIPDASYLAGGSLTFSGSSTASVINLGQIGASGGDVALIAQTVENDGTITAAGGDVGLLAGSQVTLSDTLSSNGKFQVTIGSGTSATNTGTIAAAIAELRAYGGNVYALAGNTGGSITATGVSTNDGQVFLTANAASGATGVGDVNITGGVSFSGGANALTIDAFHSAIIQTPIVTSGGHVSLTTNDAATDGVLSFGLSSAGFAGSLTFTGGAGSGESLTINGQGFQLIYTLADLSAVNANLLGSYALAGNLDASSVSYTNSVIASGASAFGGQLEGLGHSITGLTIVTSNDDVGLIGSMSGGGVSHLGLIGGSITNGTYGVDEAGNTGSLIGAADSVTVFEDYSSANVSATGDNVGGLLGLGSASHSFATGAVSGLDSVGGLIGQGSASYSFATGAVYGSAFNVGGLLGEGSASNSHATGAVTGFEDVGGLIGYVGWGAVGVNESYATGTVTGLASDGYFVGGLVGINSSTISNSYATGAVSGNSSVGGLVGLNQSNGNGISETYATGAVSGGSQTGGLVGWNVGPLQDSYFNTDTTGQSSGVGAGSSAGVTGLTTAQMTHAANFAGFDFSSTGPWRIEEGVSFPYLIFGAPASPPSGPPASISGDVYSTFGGTALGGATVNEVFVSGGSVISSGISAGGTGAYSLGAPSSNGTILLFLSGGGTLADAVVSYSGSSLAGVNLYGGYLNFPNTPASTLSGAMATLSGFSAPAGFPASDFLFTGTTPTAGIAVNTSSAAGFTVDQALTLTGSNGLAVTTTAGPITLAQPLSLASGALNLDSSAAIAIGAPVSVSGAGSVNLTYSTASPTNLSFGLTSAGFAGRLSFTGGPGSGESLTINGAAYTLLYSMNDLAGMDGSSGDYALANDLTPTTAYAGAVVPNFYGALEGLGNTISGLTINCCDIETGLIGTLWTGASVSHIGIVGGSFSGYYHVGSLVSISQGTIFETYSTANVSGWDEVGGLVSDQYPPGSLSYSFATGSVSGHMFVGGLVGSGSASHSFATGNVSGSFAGGLIGTASGISDSYATGTVTGGDFLGGLAGYNRGSIADSYATGAVNGGASIGGLVGLNGSSIEDSYATGALSGSSKVGGLVGTNDAAASISSSYWNIQTTGQSTGVGASSGTGAGTPLTTAQMQHAANFVGFDFSPTGPWRIVEGESFPYLVWQFAATPDVISGDVYSGVGGTPVVGAAVGGYENGVALSLTSSGANGYYQFLLPTGVLQNADVVTFLNGAPQKATALATGVTGSITGLNLYEGALTILNCILCQTSLSGLASNYLHALGGFASPDLVWTPGTTLTTGLVPGAGLVIDASGNFVVDQSLNLGAGALAIDVGGNLTESPSAVVWAAGLSGSSMGGASWTSSNNKVGTFAWNNSGAFGVTLDDGAAITLNAVDAGPGDLTVGGPLGYRIYDVGPLTAGHGPYDTGAYYFSGNISLSAQAGIDIRGQITAKGAVTLTGSSVGGVAEYGSGAISAASLGGSANMAVLNGANAVGTLTGFSTTNGFLFNNTQALTVSGPITGGSGLLYLQTSAGDLIVDGSLTSTGNMLLRANGDIAIDADVNTSGRLALNATGAVSETGSITADALLGYSNGSTNLSGSNTINTLLGYQVYHGGATLTLSDMVHLTVTAPVAAYAVSFTDPAGLSITGSGSVTAQGGSRTLNGAPF